MTRKLNRNSALNVVVPLIAILALLIAAAVLAQVPSVDQPSAKTNAVLAPAGAFAPAQAERPLIPWTDGAGPFPVGRSQTKRYSAVPMDSNPLFLPEVTYGTGGEFPNSVAVADLNGDGKLDLVVSNFISGSVGVLLGNGDGTFQPVTTYGTGGGWTPLSVAVGDLNGDGKPDLVVATGVIPIGFSSNISVFMGNGDGTFQPAVGYAIAADAASVAIADVNGDGKPDLLVANSGGIGTVGVLLGNGDGTFQPAVFYGSGGVYPSSVAVADVNGDGKLDLVVGNFFGRVGNRSTVGVLLGNGDGTFQTATIYDSGGNQLNSIAVADLNGDGKLDVVTGNCVRAGSLACGYRGAAAEGVVGVLLGNGDGTFQPVVTYDSRGQSASSVAIADVDGDGKRDLVVTNLNCKGCDGSIGVLLGNGDGTFQQAISYATGHWPTFVAVGDVNADGRPDLLVANSNDGSVGVLLNNTGPHSPTTTTLTSTENPVNALAPVTYTATVIGDSGSVLTGTVAFRDGAATVATVALSGNQAAYTTSYKPRAKGFHSITASYSGDFHNSVSTSPVLAEDVLVPTGTHVTTSLSPSVVGQPVTFTAAVTSSYGAIPNGETVSFYNDGAAIGTGVTAGGAVIFTTSSLTVGTHTIKVTYAGDATFEVSTGSVEQVVDKYPTTTTLSSSLNPSNYGQAVNLTATVTSAGPTPTGTVTFKNGSVILGSGTLNAGGVATLTTAKIAVGANTLTATYNGDASNGNSVSAAITQTVSQASLSMALASTPNPSTFGKSVKFTATLTSNGGVPTGQPVTFSYNSAILGTANVNGKGVATFSTTTLPQGSDAVTAAYAGSVDYSSASATVTQVVN